MSVFNLLTKKRFGPMFATQFLGAFNDNVFKNALIILIAYKVSGTDATILINLAAGLFILPFFLFSAFAGELTDKFEKTSIIKKVKFVEIIVMILATIGFIIGNNLILILILFLMGTQSTFFGPVKYSILPQHLNKDELIGGNALVEMGTFIAILLGTILGGVLVAFQPNGPILVSIALLIIAIAGWISSLYIPEAKANQPDLKINFNPLKETINSMKFLTNNKFVFQSVLGISWFWFYGYFFLAQFPSYTREFLYGNEHVVTLLLTMFSIGIGLGSFFCEKLSNKIVELGLVPIGAIGMTVFAMDLFYLYPGKVDGLSQIMGVSEFIFYNQNIRLLFDLLMIGTAGGFFIVPLYAAIQDRSEKTHVSRVIAANNIYGALFMVFAAIFAMILAKLAVSIPQMFLMISILNVIFCIFLFKINPEFVDRLKLWIKVHLKYKIIYSNKEQIVQNEYNLFFLNSEIDEITFAFKSTLDRLKSFVIDQPDLKINEMFTKENFKNVLISVESLEDIPRLDGLKMPDLKIWRLEVKFIKKTLFLRRDKLLVTNIQL